MELTRKLIEQIQAENAAVVEIVAAIADIFEEREILRNERRRILAQAEQFLHLAFTVNPERVQDFPHASEPDDAVQIALRAAARRENVGKGKEESIQCQPKFWSEPRPEAEDDHGESDDIDLAEDSEVQDFLNDHGQDEEE